MNLPVYASALVAFAVLVIGVGLVLPLAVAISLVVIAAVLAAEIAVRSRAERSEGLAALTEERRRAATRSVVADEAVTVVFIGVTWGIFWLIAHGPRGAQYAHLGALGIPGIGPLPPTALEAIAAVAAGGVVAGLYAREITARAGAWAVRPPSLARVSPRAAAENAPAGTSGSGCEFGAAYRFRTGGRIPPVLSRPADHTGPAREIALPGPSGGGSRSFRVCEAHREVLARRETATDDPLPSSEPPPAGRTGAP